MVVNSKEYESISTCNFEQRLSLCNKSTYQTENWWGKSDYYSLNKKLQPALKLGQYIFALIGIATNLFVVIIIAHKDNKETFKGLKHYSYLCLNSMFYLIILIIWLLSWINECFYPFEAFCPEFRKETFIQYFKIIFKEVVVNLLKLLSNFTYVAFALNRIALIGKDHTRIVKFISDVNIKVYIGVCFLISLSLSWIKYFKYQVNYFESHSKYFEPHLNYPISNEWNYYEENFDLNDSIKILDRFYILYISILDVINYFVFLIIFIMIEVSIVTRLRKTMNGKLMWYKQENDSIKCEANNKENKDAFKLNKLVVVNTALCIIFKLPNLLVSIINFYAAFYYWNYKNLFTVSIFGGFYSYLLDTGFYTLINDICEFLYIVSISILFFIYKRFDKNFQEGYQMFFAKMKKKFFLLERTVSNQNQKSRY